MDVFVADAGEGLVAISEIKASDWDRMTPGAVRRNVLRQARQVWEYIESQLADGHEVSPGIIFPRRPTSLRRLRFIEALFEERGIPVVWQDESIADRRTRVERVRYSRDDLSDSTLQRACFARLSVGAGRTKSDLVTLAEASGRHDATTASFAAF